MAESFGVLVLGDGEEMGDEEALTTAGRDAGGAHEALLLKMLGLSVEMAVNLFWAAATLACRFCGK